MAPGASSGALLYFGRGHVQCNTDGGLTLWHAARRGPYRGLLYWQVSRQPTAIDSAGFAAGWYEPAGALILNSGASLSAAFVAAATVTVNARARLTVSGP